MITTCLFFASGVSYFPWCQSAVAGGNFPCTLPQPFSQMPQTHWTSFLPTDTKLVPSIGHLHLLVLLVILFSGFLKFAVFLSSSPRSSVMSPERSFLDHPYPETVPPQHCLHSPPPTPGCNRFCSCYSKLHCLFFKLLHYCLAPLISI